MDLHHVIGAAAGEAASLQRLAEVHLAKGDPGEVSLLLRPCRWLAGLRSPCTCCSGSSAR